MCFKVSLVGIMKEKIKSFATIFLSLTGILILICYAVGYRFFVVETGSIKKKYPVGSMVIVKNTAPEKIKIGEVITFKIQGNILVTHRVVDKDLQQRYFITKGDANNKVDEKEVYFDNVIGKVASDIPLLGYVLYFLNSMYGKISIGILIVVYIIYTVFSFWLSKKR